jgi:hypothetical protein
MVALVAREIQQYAAMAILGYLKDERDRPYYQGSSRASSLQLACSSPATTGRPPPISGETVASPTVEMGSRWGKKRRDAALRCSAMSCKLLANEPVLMCR